VDSGPNGRVYVEMPPKYFAEMICDRVAACKIYLKKNYTDGASLNYFETRTDVGGMNPKTAENLKYFLTLLKTDGEKVMFKELKKYLKTQKKLAKNKGKSA
jgi:hypothetical protein